MERECKKHGLVRHMKVKTTQNSEGFRWRCQQCSNAYVLKRKRKVKAILVKEAGGACIRCGYNVCNRALSFHHIDPTNKSFELHSGITKSLESQRREASKCILLCLNCHAEVEDERALHLG